MTSVDAPPRAGSREWIGLAVLCLPTMLATIDVNVMFLALPRVSADLGAGSTEQLWITDIYGFMIAGFLVTMGTLGDRIGRRKLLLSGAAVFVVASLLAAYSTNTATLIGSRALLGVAGATVMPSVLALISTMFRNPRQMGAAMGLWGTSIMVGLVIGPVVGGLLLGAFWWGAIFLMGVPVMGLLLLVGPGLLPESRNPHAGRLDTASVALSLVAILPLIYGLKELARTGWHTVPVGAIVVGAVYLLVFVRHQRTLANPLLDLSLFRSRALSSALLLGMFFAFVMGGVGLMATLFMQMVKGLTPFQVGLWMLVPTIAMVGAISVASALAQRVRPAYVLAGGAVLAALGMEMMTQVTGQARLAALLTTLVIVFVGGAAVGPLTPFLIMSSAPPEKAGSAGSLQSTAGEFGVALGVAVLGLVSTAVYRMEVVVPPGIPPESAATARESVAGGATVAGQLPAEAGAALMGSAQQAFTSGFHVVANVSALLLLGLALVAVVGLRHIPPTGAAQAPPADAGPPVEAAPAPSVVEVAEPFTPDDAPPVHNGASAVR